MILYKIASFEKNVQEQYLQFLASGRSTATGLLTTTTADATSSGEKTTTTTTKQGDDGHHGVCQELFPSSSSSSHYPQTALGLWTKYISHIHSSSQLVPMDSEYEFHDLTAQLLHLISPRLPNSIKAIPRSSTGGWTSIAHILEDVLLPRWKYIIITQRRRRQRQQQQQQQPATSPTPPRPVKIVVMGGSVVAGVNCLQVFAKKVKHKLTREQCAWPFRLQQFLDRMTMEMMMGLSTETTTTTTSHDEDHHPPDSDLRLFEIHTISMGGSNTIVGNAILEFDLLPPEAKNPDIILNAYSTNDMHLLTFQKSWREETLRVLQDFIRLSYYNVTTSTTTTPSQCNQQQQQQQQQQERQRHRYPPPLVMHLDDYLGNEQREIMTTTELSQAVHILAQYYGTFVAMSYADVVRDWVYGDTKEFWFSPFEWYPPYKLNKDKMKMKREIHPTMPMHIVVPWIVSYNLLNLLIHYCDRKPYHHDEHINNNNNPSSVGKVKFSEIPKSQKIYDNEYDLARRTKRGDGLLQLPELTRKDIRLPGKPHVTPYGLPPPLTPDLSLQDISSLWRNHSLAAEAQEAEANATAASEAEQSSSSSSSLCSSTSSSSAAPKCPFAWVSRLLGEDNAMEEDTVEEYFRQNSLEYYNHGWKLRRHVDGKKLGFVPDLTTTTEEESGGGGMANLTMVFGTNSIMTTIRQVVVVYLKSYGEKWDNSRLRIRLEQKQQRQEQQQTSNNNKSQPNNESQLLVSKELVGFHAKNTSEMYIERLPLPHPIIHGTNNYKLRMEATFVSGKSFKIMGLLVCR